MRIQYTLGLMIKTLQSINLLSVPSNATSINCYKYNYMKYNKHKNNKLEEKPIDTSKPKVNLFYFQLVARTMINL